MAKVAGREVKKGDWICFKSDIEQGGYLIGIREGHPVELLLENQNGFDGAYIGGQTSTTVWAEDCWLN